MTAYTSPLTRTLKVGVIQTSLDPYSAWVNEPKMSPIEEERAISEIRAFFSALYQQNPSPDIIVLPELAVPTGFETHLKKMATQMKSVVIAGFDYRRGTNPAEVHNDALIIVPKVWRGRKMGAKTTVRRIGKTYAAPEEAVKLGSIKCQFKHDPTVWLFDGGEIGSFGVMICYDFLDLERIAMYRRRVHHLFILALNKDSTSFNLVAESVSRTVFCNVVICNCGFFGGSIAVSPYRFSDRRTIYRHGGAGLATMQVIELPVSSLDLHQHENPPLKDGKKVFKSLPPGFSATAKLLKKKDVV